MKRAVFISFMVSLGIALFIGQGYLQYCEHLFDLDRDRERA